MKAKNYQSVVRNRLNSKKNKEIKDFDKGIE